MSCCDKEIVIGLILSYFDPPTLDHLAISRILIKLRKVDAIWFVPIYSYNGSSYIDRMSMCYSLIKKEPDIYLSIDDYKYKSSDSVLSVKRIVEKNNDKCIKLIIGIDDNFTVDDWANGSINDLVSPIFVGEKILDSKYYDDFVFFRKGFDSKSIKNFAINKDIDSLIMSTSKSVAHIIISKKLYGY